jgi:hypothetical protein
MRRELPRVMASMALALSVASCQGSHGSVPAGAGGGSATGTGSAGGDGTGGASEPGDGTCAAPFVIEAGHPLDSQTTADAGSALSAADPSCLGVETSGPEQVYRIAVPARGTTRLRLTVTPVDSPAASAFDPVVYLTKNCTASPLVCLGAEDRRGGGSPELVQHTNATGETENVFVVVDGYDFQPKGGAYGLAVELASP